MITYSTHCTQAKVELVHPQRDEISSYFEEKCIRMYIYIYMFKYKSRALYKNPDESTLLRNGSLGQGFLNFSNCALTEKNNPAV